MNEPQKIDPQPQPQEPNLSDIEIAELANQELKKKEREIAELKKQLAKEKLYSSADQQEREVPSKEECLKVITSGNTSNYDYAQAVVDLVDIETGDGNPNPLGKNGQEVYDFFKDCIDECEGDKNRFTSIYQARLGNDDPKVSLAYGRRK